MRKLNPVAKYGYSAAIVTLTASCTQVFLVWMSNGFDSSSRSWGCAAVVLPTVLTGVIFLTYVFVADEILKRRGAGTGAGQILGFTAVMLTTIIAGYFGLLSMAVSDGYYWLTLPVIAVGMFLARFWVSDLKSEWTEVRFIHIVRGLLPY